MEATNSSGNWLGTSGTHFPLGHTNAKRIYRAGGFTQAKRLPVSLPPSRCAPRSLLSWEERGEAAQAWAEPEGRGSPRPSLAERREAERARRPADRPQGGTCWVWGMLQVIFACALFPFPFPFPPAKTPVFTSVRNGNSDKFPGRCRQIPRQMQTNSPADADKFPG